MNTLTRFSSVIFTHTGGHTRCRQMQLDFEHTLRKGQVNELPSKKGAKVYFRSKTRGCLSFSLSLFRSLSVCVYCSHLSLFLPTIDIVLFHSYAGRERAVCKKTENIISSSKSGKSPDRTVT